MGYFSSLSFALSLVGPKFLALGSLLRFHCSRETYPPPRSALTQLPSPPLLFRHSAPHPTKFRVVSMPQVPAALSSLSPPSPPLTSHSTTPHCTPSRYILLPSSYLQSVVVIFQYFYIHANYEYFKDYVPELMVHRYRFTKSPDYKRDP